MLTLIFIVLMLAVFGKLIVWAIQAAWGITKVLVTIIFFPFVLIVMACSGLIYLALICLVIGGIATLIGSALA